MDREEPSLAARCTVLVMGRAKRVLIVVGLLAVTFVPATRAWAAGEIVVAASPSEVRVGEPVEILLRTFVPVQREGVLPGTRPREPYPVASGFWDLLYPWDDYPFDIVAQHEDGTEVPVNLARDPTDSTLWRGIVTLPMVGMWTIQVRNFRHDQPGLSNYGQFEPGSTTVVKAKDGPSRLSGPSSGLSDPSSGSVAQVSTQAAAAIIWVMVGLVGGLIMGRSWGRRPRA